MIKHIYTANVILDEGASALAESLMNNNTLAELNVENNAFGDETKESLQKAWGERDQSNLTL